MINTSMPPFFLIKKGQLIKQTYFLFDEGFEQINLYKYNNNNNIIEEVIHTPDKIVIYKYNVKGDKIEEVNQAADGTTYSKQLIEYYSDKIIITDFDSDTLKAKRVHNLKDEKIVEVLKYNSNSKLISQAEYSYKGNETKNRTYSAKGTLILETIKKTREKIKNEYNDLGKIIK